MLSTYIKQAKWFSLCGVVVIFYVWHSKKMLATVAKSNQPRQAASGCMCCSTSKRSDTIELIMCNT